MPCEIINRPLTSFEKHFYETMAEHYTELLQGDPVSKSPSKYNWRKLIKRNLLHCKKAIESASIPTLETKTTEQPHVLPLPQNTLHSQLPIYRQEPGDKVHV